MTRSGPLARVIQSARLLMTAWRLHGEAQALASGASLDEVRAGLATVRRAAATPSPAEATWAAAWAGRIGRRLGGRLDTCLVRALVAGALIRSDREVAVCIGVYRPWSTGDLLDAHAWVTLDGDEIAAETKAPNPYETILTLPLHSVS